MFTLLCNYQISVPTIFQLRLFTHFAQLILSNKQLRKEKNKKMFRFMFTLTRASVAITHIRATFAFN